MSRLSVSLRPKGLYFLRTLSTGKMPKKKAVLLQGECNNSVTQGPVIANSCGTVTVNVLAKPNAKESCITGITSEGVSIQIAAPPVDGEANSVLVKYLSKVLGLRKSDVCLARGSKSRMKSFVVSGMTKEDVETKLTSQCDHR